MTCALVPENPNELTPAMRGRRRAAQGVASSHHLHRKAIPRNVRRRIPKVQVLRQYLVLERQDDLDHARDARGGFQVPDVRLHRSDQQRPSLASRPSPSAAAAA